MAQSDTQDEYWSDIGQNFKIEYREKQLKPARSDT